MARRAADMPTVPLAPVIRYLRKVTDPASSGELPDAELLSRFALHRDEAAFTTLVRRHGPMVLAVCCRVVRDGHVAEDAFQATFLVLAHKAGSLTQPELLGHWLHGVAYRTAMKARREAAKCRARETLAACAEEVHLRDESEWQDLRAVLDEEVNRLPERYRVPVVLCYLQGETNAEAARRLGCSRGTVATLLARARNKLRRRLTQRGVGLSVGIALAALTQSVRGRTVPLALEQGTVKAAMLFGAGQTLSAGALPTQAVALAKGVSKGMLMEKLKIPVAVLTMTVLMGAGAGVSVYRAGAPEPEVTEAAREAKPHPQDKSQERKPLDDNRTDKPSRPREAAPTISEVRHPVPTPAPVAPLSFRKKLPTGLVPLQQILVVLDKDRRLTVGQKVAYYQPVTEEVTLKSGRKTRVTTYEEGDYYRTFVYPVDRIRVYDTKGRKVETKELGKRLKGETLALMSTDGRPIDPLHLRLYKEDTLVFVIGQQPPPGVPPTVGVPAAPYATPPPAAPAPATVPAPTGVVPPPAVVDPEESVPPSGP
jgi:RNA polymerase sigma factor (sigma-70 family)